jgi:hypothetical protein
MTELTLHQLMRATHAEEDAAEIWLEPLNKGPKRRVENQEGSMAS